MPNTKFKQGQYITNRENQSFVISFVEWDFEREVYYCFPITDTYVGKIYESKTEFTDPPKDPSVIVYEIPFEKNNLLVESYWDLLSRTEFEASQKLVLAGSA